MTVKEFKELYRLAKPSLSKDGAANERCSQLYLINGNAYAIDGYVMTIMGNAYTATDDRIVTINREDLIELSKELRQTPCESDEIMWIPRCAQKIGGSRELAYFEPIRDIAIKAVEKLLVTLPIPKFGKEHEEISLEFDISRNIFVSKYRYIGLDFSENDTVRYVEPNTQTNYRSSVVNVSITYLKSILRRTKGDITVDFGGEVAPLVFKCSGLPDLTHILMPVRPL